MAEAVKTQQDQTDNDASEEQQKAKRLLLLLRTLALELNPSRREVLDAGLDASLEKDFGIDSLARVELVLRIEQAFQTRLPEQLVVAAETPVELLRAVGLSRATAVPTPLSPRAAPVGAVQPAPSDARTLIDVLKFHAAEHGDRVHVTLLRGDAEEQPVTYRDLSNGAHAVAAGLRSLDLELGACVAIMLPTGLEFLECFFGVLLAGGVPVPLYPPVRRSALEEHLRRQTAILENARAPILIAPEEARPFTQVLRSLVDTLRTVTTPGDVKTVPPEAVRPAVHGEDLGLVQYTSGSTGDPKGVMLTHSNLLANIRAIGRAFNATSEDVVVGWLPLYHDMGLIGIWLGSLYYACPLVLMSPLSFLGRPQRWLQAISRYRGTISAAPNFGYDLCWRKVRDEDLDSLDLSSWRLAGNGAEAVSVQTIDGFCGRFGAHGFRREAMMPMYGLAECSVALTNSPLGRGPLIDHVDRAELMNHDRATEVSPDVPGAMAMVSCGIAVPGHEIRIVDETDREVGERAQGRIQFRGPSATMGYMRNRAKTEDLMHGDWRETGDLGYVANGELYVTGRRKDIVVRAGRNIYPEEIEYAVGDVDGVRTGRVAAFGARDPRTGTEGLVVLAETRESDPAKRNAITNEIRSIVSDLVELPPEDIVLGPPGSVLKTLNGKVRRAACAADYEAGTIGRAPPAAWRRNLRLLFSAIGPTMRVWLRAVKAFAYASWFWTVYRGLAPFVWIGVVFCPFLLARRRVMRAGSRVMLRLLGAMPVVRGLNNVPLREPCVIVANHMSFLDGLALSAVLPPTFAFVAKRELIEAPIARHFFDALGTAYVERIDIAAGIEDARRLMAILKDGNSLVIFPEGTFDRRPGLRAFEMGAFVLAADAGVPVVPAGINGTRSILRAGSNFPRPGRITLAFGEPINPQGSDWNAALRLRDAARSSVLLACGEPDLIDEAVTIPGRNG